MSSGNPFHLDANALDAVLKKLANSMNKKAFVPPAAGGPAGPPPGAAPPPDPTGMMGMGAAGGMPPVDPAMLAGMMGGMPPGGGAPPGAIPLPPDLMALLGGAAPPPPPPPSGLAEPSREPASGSPSESSATASVAEMKPEDFKTLVTDAVEKGFEAASGAFDKIASLLEDILHELRSGRNPSP